MWSLNHDVPMEDGSITPEDTSQTNQFNCDSMDTDMEQGNSNSSTSLFNANTLSSPLYHKLDINYSPGLDISKNPRVEHLICLFKDLTISEQMELFKRLLEESSTESIRNLRQLIEPHFQRDFLSCLPIEIGLLILKQLDGKDILNITRVSKNWRIICEVDALWRHLCGELGMHLPEASNRVDGAWASTALVQGVKIPEHISNLELIKHRNKKQMKKSSMFERAPDKSRYLRMQRIEQNWRENPIRGSCVLKGHEDHVITCMQIHGDLLVTGSDDNTLKVWSIDRGEMLFNLTGHTGGVWTSQISQCGKYIISGSTDRTVKIWSTSDGSLIHTLQGHTSTVRCMALWKDTLVTGSRDTTLRIWDFKKGKIRRVLVGHQAAVRCVQFDGRTVVSGGYDFTVKVWDAMTGSCVKTLTGHLNRVYSLLFEKERYIVASGSLDTTIRVWDLKKEDGKECIAQLIGHTSLTSGMQLRGNILVSCNADSQVRVWDIRDGSCLFPLNGHRSAITSLQFFGDNVVATSSDDGTVKLWDIKKGVFLRDLVTLDSGGNGGCIWRLCSTPSLLACAVGSRNNTEETKVILIDFDSPYP